MINIDHATDFEPPPTAAPESEVGFSGCQVARNRDGHLWGANEIISWERKVPPLGIGGIRSGRHRRELSIRRQRIQPTGQSAESNGSGVHCY